MVVWEPKGVTASSIECAAKKGMDDELMARQWRTMLPKEEKKKTKDDDVDADVVGG